MTTNSAAEKRRKRIPAFSVTSGVVKAGIKKGISCHAIAVVAAMHAWYKTVAGKARSRKRSGELKT